MCLKFAARSKAVVLLLLIHFLLLLLMFFGGFSVKSLFCNEGLCVLFKFNNYLDDEERASCFTLTVFLMFCDSQFSVSLPRKTVGWPAVCNSYLFLFCNIGQRLIGKQNIEIPFT